MAGVSNSLNIAGAGAVVFDGVDSFSPASITNHGTVIGLAANSITSLGVATNGQLVIGSTGAAPILGNITSSGNTITITNGAGTINLEVNATFQIANYTAVVNSQSPYTVLSTDYYIGANVTSGVITLRLPNAPTTGRIFVVKDSVGLSATSNITITTVGGAVNIDGATSYVMNTNYQALQLIFNGTSYELY